MAKKVYKTSRKYQCPFCDMKLPRMELITHVDKKHETLIPENYTAARVVYDSINKTDHGTCMICKKPVYEWNDKTLRYNNLCNDKKCREEVRRIALERHIKAYNVPTLLNNPEHQEKMLAGRHISGKYRYSDGAIFTYTGKYEKAALEFMDNVMNIPSKDIQMPGPILEYEYKGETHSWITDIYYIPANLIIEVKDGGNNPNNRNMPDYRGKQKAKEIMITELGKFNYLRLTNNDFSQLLEALADIKYENLDQRDSNKVNFYINESALNEMEYFNSAGKKVPRICPKCKSKVHIEYNKGQPIFKCTNPECGRKFGAPAFTYNEEVGGLPPRRASSDTYIEPCLLGNTFDYAIGNDMSDTVYVRTIDDEFKAIKKDEFEKEYKTPGEALVYTGEDSTDIFNSLTSCKTFSEMLYKVAGFKFRVIDELALTPNWFFIDKNQHLIESNLIATGVSNNIREAIKDLKFNSDIPIKGSVLLSSSNKGYFVHTPKDYYLSSDFYDSVEEIPQNIIDTMADLYEQYKRRQKDEER